MKRREAERERSIVRVRRWSDGETGLGVYIGDEVFLTVAHCLPVAPDHSRPGWAPVWLDIERLSGGEAVTVETINYDGCADLAVLGESPRDHRDLIIELAADLAPARVRLLPPVPEQPIQLAFRTRDGEWWYGSAQPRDRLGMFLHVHGDDGSPPVTAGTSGSPAFDESDQVVGLLSAGGPEGEGPAGVVVLANVMPGWLLHKLGGSQAEPA